jgi:hypothetical protein
MKLPKNLALQTVQRKNVHHDKKSSEVSTGVTKAKYKLAGTVIPGDEGVLFWIFTSSTSSYPRDKTIQLQSSDYAWCKHQTLMKKQSYVCIDRYDYLHTDVVYQKMNDANNGFKCVAQITDSAFNKLTTLRPKIKLTNNKTLEDLQKIIKATAEAEDYDQILKNMGL